MVRAAFGPCGSTPHIRPQLTTATTTCCCGPERFRLSVAGSIPVRSIPRSGSSVGRASGPCVFHDCSSPTRYAIDCGPEPVRLSVRAPGRAPGRSRIRHPPAAGLRRLR
jgi:hypothetical protein